MFFLFPIDNLSAQVLKVDIYRHILVTVILALSMPDEGYVGFEHTW
jgi:hypothetical protein